MNCAPFFLAAANMATGSASAELTAAVRPHAGHPTLFINERPTAPLIFFGSVRIGGAPTDCDVGPGWQRYSVTFAPTEDDSQASIHIHLGADLGPPGDVWIDDVRLGEGQTFDAGPNLLPGGDFEQGEEGFAGDWVLFVGEDMAQAEASIEADGATGNACLHIHIDEPGTIHYAVHIYSKMLSVQAGRRYTLSAMLRSSEERRATLFLVHQGDPWNVISGEYSPALKEIGLAARNGFHLHSFSLPLPWGRDREPPDFSGVDAAMGAVLAEDPEALCLPRFGMSPPGWWFEAHPDGRMQFDDDTGEKEKWESPASEAWRRDACEALRVFVRYLEDNYGEHIFGYHPCGQHTGEWFYQESWTPKLHGFDPATEAGFRRWLAERYGTNEALQTAWADRAAILATATVPTVEQRLAPGLGTLREPATDRRVVDFHEYLSVAMEEPLEMFARVIKQETGGRKIVTLFYGYFYDMCGVPRGPAATGHFQMGRLLECPDVDILCSPISYFDRDLLGSGPFMTAVDSVALHGKIWLNEDDTRTYLSEESDPFSRVATPPETHWVHQRNFGQIFTRRCATWWMDLPGTGWLASQEIWDNLVPLRGIYEKNLDVTSSYAPEVAIIADEPSVFWLTATNALSQPLLYEMRQQLNRLGAPVGWYYLQDLAVGRVPEAKVYIFLNAFYVPEAARQQLNQRIRRPGTLAVWMYAPGVLNEAYDPGASVLLTGLPLVAVDDVAAPRIAVAHEAQQALGGVGQFGTEAALSPLFAAWPRADADVRVLGTWEGTTHAAFAEVEQDGWRSVFIGSPTVPAAVLRGLVRSGGAHIYLDSDDHVMGNGRYLFIHAVTAGTKAVALPSAAAVTDALTGRPVATGERFHLQMEAGETRVLSAEVL